MGGEGYSAKAVAPTVAESVGEAWPPGIAKKSATTADPVVVPVARAFWRCCIICKVQGRAVFERTGFNSVLLSMTVVPISQWMCQDRLGAEKFQYVDVFLSV